MEVGAKRYALLGELEFFAAGFDGLPEGVLEGGSGRHPASLPAAHAPVDDIGVDTGADNPLRSAPMTFQ